MLMDWLQNRNFCTVIDSYTLKQKCYDPFKYWKAGQWQTEKRNINYAIIFCIIITKIQYAVEKEKV